MVELEASSTFAFQGSRWLADVAPHLLSTDLRDRIARSKVLSERRQAIESELPQRLMFTAGWPTVLPTRDEASLV
ncbi:hypothetical protein SB776_34475, partial [Burkholderia sp. SIMBA_045]